MLITEPRILIKHRQLCKKNVSFARGIFHTSKYFCECVGACAYDRTSLVKGPGKSKQSVIICKIKYWGFFDNVKQVIYW